MSKTEPKRIFADKKPEQIEIELNNIAYKIEFEQLYSQYLTPVQIEQYKEVLYKKTLEIFELYDELKAYSKEKKEQIKNLEVLQHEAVAAIKNKSILTRGNLYLVDDQKNGQMLVYDSSGFLVETRDLKPEEKQLYINSIQANK